VALLICDLAGVYSAVSVLLLLLGGIAKKSRLMAISTTDDGQTCRLHEVMTMTTDEPSSVKRSVSENHITAVLVGRLLVALQSREIGGIGHGRTTGSIGIGTL